MSLHIRWSIGDEKMLINECPRCTQCCEKGRIQERIKIKWKALYKGEDESYVAACKNCKRLYFIPFWTLIVQAISDLLVLPWVLAPALFSKSIYISAFSWIGVFVLYAAVDFLFSLFPWKEIPRDDYPAIKRRYSRISVFLKIIKYPTSIIFATIIAANLLYPH